MKVELVALSLMVIAALLVSGCCCCCLYPGHRAYGAPQYTSKSTIKVTANAMPVRTANPAPEPGPIKS